MTSDLNSMYGYAGAWNFRQHDYTYFFHTGFFPGYSSIIGILPNKNIGLYIEILKTNSFLPEMLLEYTFKNLYNNIDLNSFIKNYKMLYHIQKYKTLNNLKIFDSYYSLKDILGVYLNEILGKITLKKYDNNEYQILIFEYTYDIIYRDNYCYFELSQFNAIINLIYINKYKIRLINVSNNEKYDFLAQGDKFETC